MENVEYPTAKGAIRRFADITGMHGPPNIAVSRSWLRRIYWILLTLGGTAACAWQLHDAIVKLISHPTSTTTTVVFASPMNFPAVTLCNLNPIRYGELVKYASNPYVKEMTDVMKTPVTGPGSITGGVTGKSWDAFDQKSDREDFTNSATLFKAMSSLPKDVLKNLSYSLSDILVDCSFTGRHCIPKDFLTFQSSRYGNCYMFNSGFFGNGSANEIKVVNKSGPAYGLALTLYVDQNDYIPDLITKAGFRVQIHDRHNPPLPESHGYEVSPGLETAFGIRTTIFERASPPYGRCMNFTAAENETTNHVVDQLSMTFPSSEICQQTCEQIEFINSCGCNSYANGFTSAPAYKKLNKTDRGRACRVKQNSQDYECIQKVTQTVSQPSSYCKSTFCKYQECIVIRYDVTPSSALWPAERAFNTLVDSVKNHPNQKMVKKLLNKTASEQRNFIYRNFVKVGIYFEDLNINYIKTASTYGAFEFIADLGGIFGLWLGFSILTFFEIVELVIDLIIALAYCGKIKDMESKIDAEDEGRESIELRGSQKDVFGRPERRAEAATIK